MAARRTAHHGVLLPPMTLKPESGLGVSLQQGGEHAVFHTHNRLLGLEDGLYLEAIAVNPERERAHKITHGTLIHPDDYARFAELGVIYDTTGSWMTFDPLMQTIATDRLGADRVKAMFPVNRVVDAGGTFSFGSDWPVSGYVSEYRPLSSIEAGVTRQLRGRRDVPPLGGEEAKLPLQLALEAHTINAARGMAMDKEIGSLEVGKKADIVVLDQDLFEVEPEAISDVQVLYTIMGGELTFEKGE